VTKCQSCASLKNQGGYNIYILLNDESRYGWVEKDEMRGTENLKRGYFPLCWNGKQAHHKKHLGGVVHHIWLSSQQNPFYSGYGTSIHPLPELSKF